jgi:hypothetical protein
VNMTLRIQPYDRVFVHFASVVCGLARGDCFM